MTKVQAGYKNLIAWQKTDDLVISLYTITGKFPKSEVYGISSQLRRAGLSIATNIVEGYARNSKKEFKRFVSIAIGSLAEVKYLLSVANRLSYFEDLDYNHALNLSEEVGRILWKLYSSL